MIPAHSLKLLYLRAVPDSAPFHLWGGKRISEHWDARKRKLSLVLQGPAGLRDAVFLGGANRGIQSVRVGGKPAPFCLDRAQGLAHDQVTFTAKPLLIEVLCSREGTNGLPEIPTATAPPR